MKERNQSMTKFIQVKADPNHTTHVIAGWGGIGKSTIQEVVAVIVQPLRGNCGRAFRQPSVPNRNFHRHPPSKQ